MCKSLDQDILASCDPNEGTPIKGILGKEVVLVKWNDIRSSVTINQDDSTVSQIRLSAGTTGYKLQVLNSNLHNFNSTYALNTEDYDGFTHSFSSRLSTTSSENAEIAKRIKDTSEGFVVILRTKFSGAGRKDEFKVLGLTKGLMLSEMTVASNENSSSILFTLSTPEGCTEAHPYNIIEFAEYSELVGLFDGNFQQGS